MASIHDVAVAVLERQDKISAMKLQKLVYYCQAWHLVWEERPLFAARFEAWANGPVAPELYRIHRGQFLVNEWPSGDASRLTKQETETVDAVVNAYGGMSGVALAALAHQESPWRDARRGLEPGERGNAVITPAAMAEYYGGLYDAQG